MPILLSFFGSPNLEHKQAELFSWLASQTVRHFEAQEQKLKYSLGVTFIRVFNDLLTN